MLPKKQKLEHLIQFKNCSPSERSQNFPKETKLPRSQLYKDSRNIEKIMKFPHRLLSARIIFTNPNDYRSTGLFLEAQGAVMTKYRHLRSCGLRVTVKWLRISMKLYCDTVKPIHKFKNGSYPFTKTWKNSQNRKISQGWHFTSTFQNQIKTMIFHEVTPLTKLENSQNRWFFIG